ncbi:hypothetical protein APT62_01780 [Aerococcus urinaeequi]|nr:DUF2316 family protein [Aerococcus urinaeequi]ALZ87252.1 hypothetical protein APT62_01780 [Aerococcus urinaeequi]
MSLTYSQQKATIREFQEAVMRSNLTIQEIAGDFKTSQKRIDAILNLQPLGIEEPWILKECLNEKITDQGNSPVKFTALRGDYHQYGFLNSSRIGKRQLYQKITV